MKKSLLYILFFAMFSPQLSAQADGVKTVVIDAGHGGTDPGNIGTKRYKIYEKDVALAVALKLGKTIEENLDDVKVIFTRKTDVLIDLKERAAIANRAEADLFISIHCDSWTDKSVHGTTSIVMGKNHGDENLRVAMNENAVIYLEENYEENYGGFDPSKPESYIAFSLYQSAFFAQSVSFAQKVQEQFRERVKRRDRGVKQQPLMVTKMAVMPAVLVELGFLTNPNEEDFLMSEKGQDYMASAIFRAFRDYKEERESFQFEATEVPPVVENLPKESEIKTTDSEVAITNPAVKDSLKTEEPKAVESVYFTVQIATSGRKKELIPANFKGVEGVEIYEDGGLYKYVVGRAEDAGSAEAVKQDLRKRGFPDAFVVAISNGKRVSLSEAEELLQ